ncbi:glycosyltransferase family 39 protein [Micromonospora sp. MS34]|uniref:glycosyltransferase family 39 protein n=1 Tax=Micromonospora sp. MS34 TaxID=3385971 RepID=UPI0039A03836
MDRTQSLLTAPTTGSTTTDPATVPAPDSVPKEAVHPPAEPPRREPRWARPALAGLLLATALLYLWGLGASGWGNAFYSAAVQAGSESWKAFFYGSSDAANSITVDKTPASLWLMALSVRVFGLSSWSILVPQALLGVASVGVLYAAVRRWYGPAAGLIAGAVLATTPVATLMFRFNNPDALLVLLLVTAAYATVRAVETASTRWIVLTGALIGLGFLTKMLQAFLVIPVFAGVYLLAAPTGFWRRIRQLLLSGLAVLVAAGWWVAIVELVPAGARPYIGGSQHNSILELTLGYNGLGRITGDEVGSVGGAGRPGGGGGGPFSGQSGLLRMFDTEVGGQISWLLPAALILLVAGLVLAGRAARTDRTRAGLLLWGGWLLVTGLIFSFMSGIFHAYYTVALAPAIGALVGIGVTLLWRARSAPPATLPAAGYAPATGSGPVLPATGSGPVPPVTGSGPVPPATGSDPVAAAPPSAGPVPPPAGLVSSGPVGAVPATDVAASGGPTRAGAAVDRTAHAVPAGAPVRPGRTRALAATGTLALTLAVTAWWSWHLLGRSADWYPWLRTAVLVVGLAAAVLLVLADRLARRVVPMVLALGAAAALAGPVAYALETAATPHTGSIPSAGPFVQGAFGPGGRGAFGPGGNGGFPGVPGGQNGGAGQNGARNGQFPGFPGGGANGRFPGGAGRSARGGGMGGLLDAREPSAELKALLEADADDYTWVGASIGSNNASGYQLATRRPVMPIGGFNGSDPSPTLAQFQQYVAAGKIHYFIGGGGFRANGGSNASQEIAAWVAEHFTAKTVDGVTVYDLSSGKQG